MATTNTKISGKGEDLRRSNGKKRTTETTTKTDPKNTKNSLLDDLIPAPRLLEVDHVDLALPPERAWAVVRHADFASVPLVHALFALRTLPSKRGREDEEEMTFQIDDLHSTPERPGFQLLAERDGSEFAVGAIGKVWHLDIPFVHVDSAKAFASFDAPDFAKVAWAIRIEPLGSNDTRVSFELRVDATDEPAMAKFRDYFHLIGPFSHLIRHTILAHLAREHGTPESKEDERRLEGDELIADTSAQVTHTVTIAASPEAIWPWLVQMGCRRAGFYSYDMLDNGGTRSAREIHPELQDIRVGDVLPATPTGTDGFEVIRIEPQRALVLGGLFDPKNKKQLPFRSERPMPYWQATWAFVLEKLDDKTTKLHVRARVAFPPSEQLHAGWIWLVHHFMERKQLQRLAALVEGRARHDDWRDVLDGALGAIEMVACFLTPFLRGARSTWGVGEELARRKLPGDDYIPEPRWGWTHGIEIDASADDVWPWVAQIGADRGGFYSYQWLENVAGCDLRNAETIHPEWEIKPGPGPAQSLVLHPKMPPLPIVEVIPKRAFVAYAAAEPGAKAAGKGKPWIETTWLFYIEPLRANKCVFISRYRCACSDDLATRIKFGAPLIEPIGFAMDRRMLMGVKHLAERGQPIT